MLTCMTAHSEMEVIFLHECFERYESPGVTPGYLLKQSFYALFYGLFFGLFLTGLVNWKRKKSLWNTALIVLLYFVLLVVGAFRGRVIHYLIQSFSGFFSSKIGISCLIGSQVALIVGILLVWLSVTNFTRSKER